MKTFEPYYAEGVIDQITPGKPYNSPVIIPLTEPNVFGQYMALVVGQRNNTAYPGLSKHITGTVIPSDENIESVFHFISANLTDNYIPDDAVPITEIPLTQSRSQVIRTDDWIGRQFYWENGSGPQGLYMVVGLVPQKIYGDYELKPVIINLGRIESDVTNKIVMNDSDGIVRTLPTYLSSVVTKANWYASEVPDGIVWINLKKVVAPQKKKYFDAGMTSNDVPLFITNTRTSKLTTPIFYNEQQQMLSVYQKSQYGVNNFANQKRTPGYVLYDKNQHGVDVLRVVSTMPKGYLYPERIELTDADIIMSFCSNPAIQNNTRHDLIFIFGELSSYKRLWCLKQENLLWYFQQNNSGLINQLRVAESKSGNDAYRENLIEKIKIDIRNRTISSFANIKLPFNRNDYPAEYLNENSAIASTLVLAKNTMLLNDKEFLTGDVYFLAKKKIVVLTKIIDINKNGMPSENDMFLLAQIDKWLDGQYEFDSITNTQIMKRVLIFTRKELRALKPGTKDVYARNPMPYLEAWNDTNANTKDSENHGITGLKPVVANQLDLIDWTRVAEIKKKSPDIYEKFVDVIKGINEAAPDDIDIKKHNEKYRIIPVAIIGQFDNLLEFPPLTNANQHFEYRQDFVKSLDYLGINSPIAASLLKIEPIERFGNLAMKNEFFQGVDELETWLKSLLTEWKQNVGELAPMVSKKVRDRSKTSDNKAFVPVLTFLVDVVAQYDTPISICIRIGPSWFSIGNVTYFGDLEEYVDSIDKLIDTPRLISNTLFASALNVASNVSVFNGIMGYNMEAEEESLTPYYCNPLIDLAATRLIEAGFVPSQLETVFELMTERFGQNVPPVTSSTTEAIYGRTSNNYMSVLYGIYGAGNLSLSTLLLRTKFSKNVESWKQAWQKLHPDADFKAQSFASTILEDWKNMYVAMLDTTKQKGLGKVFVQNALETNMPMALKALLAPSKGAEQPSDEKTDDLGAKTVETKLNLSKQSKTKKKQSESKAEKTDLESKAPAEAPAEPPTETPTETPTELDIPEDDSDLESLLLDI